MARARTASQGGIAFSAGEISQKFGVKFLGRLLTEKALRRIIPYLLILFFATLLAGTLGHFIYGKRIAIDDARNQISLIADTIAANLQNTGSSKKSDWQNRLARSLPAGATLEDRLVLLADGNGVVKATAPITAKKDGRALLQILGKDQPVTTFGAQAGVLQLTLADGRDALVTVRNIPNSQAQITLLQPTETALRNWRRDAAVDTTLSMTTGILLLLIGASFRWLSERATRAEEALSAKQQDLDIAFDKSDVGLWDWNVARGHVRVSRAMRALAGWNQSEENVPYRDIAAAIHSDDDLYGAVEAAVRKGQENFDQTFRLRHKDGHWMTLRFQGALRRDADASETHLIGVVSPHGNVHGVAHSAPVADIRLHDAIEAISEAFVLWDSDNRLVLCNSKYKQFYNLSDEAVVPGTPYEQIIAEAKAPIVRTRNTMCDDKTSGAHTYEAQLEDGNWLHIDERRTNDGCYVSVGTDITSLKQSQQRHAKSEEELKATITDLQHSRRELEQQKQQLVDLAEKYALEKNRAEAANRTKSEFLANISHELRTPLNAVIGFSEVMENGLLGPVGNQKYVEYARDIHESGKYLLEVINDILDMSKIEAGRINLDIMSLDAGEIAEDSIRVVAQAAGERSIEVKRAGLKQLKMRADKRAVKQILLNLLSNAVKFTPDGGKVTVKLSKAKGYAKITIADTGIGIPESELGKLGRPFEQVENQLTKTRAGSGLGLAISRSLVEMHGGKFEIKSAESEGTTVICHLPLKPILSETSLEAA
jgi:two-component system cell cycle sensor histidine kinase PleC